MDLWVVERSYYEKDRKINEGTVGVFSTKKNALEYISTTPNTDGYHYDCIHLTLDEPND